MVFMRKLKSVYINGAYLMRRYLKEGFTYRAAALAYTTLLAIVPITILSFSILSLFPIFNGMAAKLRDIILSNFVATSADKISFHLDLFLQHSQELSWSNIVFLAVIGLLMIYDINRAFCQVWKNKTHVSASLSFLIYFIFLLLSPLVFGGVMVFGTFVLRLTLIKDLIFPESHQTILLFLRHGLVLVVFTFFNWVLPFTRVKFRHALLGGFIATVLFDSAKWVFAGYLNHFSSYQLVYGALAILPIFLVWLYVSWTIILLSALITQLVACGIPQQERDKLDKML